MNARVLECGKSPAAFSLERRVAILHRSEFIRPIPKRQGTAALQYLRRFPIIDQPYILNQWQCSLAFASEGEGKRRRHAPDRLRGKETLHPVGSAYPYREMRLLSTLVVYAGES
jgi:hypothetical protein